MEDHWVYRAFDVAGTPIYVGYSGSGAGRLKQHRRESGWSHLVARFEIEHFDTAPEALNRERDLIHEQNPACNVVLRDRDALTPPDGMWNVKQVAEWLQFPSGHIKTMARKGEIPAEKRGGLWCFAPSVLADWVRSHDHVPEPMLQKGK